MPTDKRPLKVFLSYASQDKLLVRELSRRLVGEGWIDTWQDEKNLLPGQDWRLNILDAVETSDIVIICLSKSSVNKEGYVQKELRYAQEIALEKPEGMTFLIPLRLDECEVPRGLRFYQWVDYFDDKKDTSYIALIASLKLRYEQKLKVEEEERLRKKQQELEAAAKAAREKAEKEAAERERIKAEKEERNKIAKEKAALEALKRERKNGKKEPPIRRQSAYWLGGFIVLVFGAIFFSRLTNSLKPEPTLVIKPSQVFTTSTKTETSTPSTTPSPEPTLTYTVTSTSTPVPSRITDSKGVPMALVPAGNFIMGSKNGDVDEVSVHEVYLNDFYIDIFEVTNALYNVCISDGVCDVPNSGYYQYSDYSDHPVVNVTWAQADQYCKWRGGYLPTEAQWEKAARGGDERTYPWGEEVDCTKANYRTCVGNTAKIGSYESGKSPYGVYDLAGNVWEWVADWYDDNYYQYSPSSNPLGPTSGKYRVIRGGSWSFRIDDLPAYNRRESDPDSDRNTIGFRCAKDVP